MKCKICGGGADTFDSAPVLGKYQVNYYCCQNCGFVQTEEPYWLDEAYTSAFAATDTGTMKRNMDNAANLLFLFRFIKNGPCLDFGGGYGALARMMRDNGFDFYCYDKYAANLFAGGFDGGLNRQYALVTSFENFEHFVNPLEEIAAILRVTGTLFFTTMLLPPPPPRIKDWVYYAPEHGQHISFYSKKTLKFIANTRDMYFLTDNFNTHILSKTRINPAFFKFLRLYNILNNRLSVARYLKQPTKVYSDIDILRKR